MTIDRLLHGAQRGFLWTFTFKHVQSIKISAAMWSHARRDLVRDLGFTGVRVFEMHPGGHGLHIHIVTRKYYDVRQIRAVTDKHGLGRIHVKPIPPEGFHYTAKYLDKTHRVGGLKGMRLWGAIGDLIPVKVSNIKVVGHMAYCWHRAAGWLARNMPIASTSKGDRFHALKAVAMRFYARGEFDGYEQWRTLAMSFYDGRISFVARRLQWGET